MEYTNDKAMSAITSIIKNMPAKYSGGKCVANVLFCNHSEPKDILFTKK